MILWCCEKFVECIADGCVDNIKKILETPQVIAKCKLKCLQGGTFAVCRFNRVYCNLMIPYWHKMKMDKYLPANR